MRNSAGLTRREFIVKSVTAISAVYIIPDLIPKADCCQTFRPGS